MTAGIQLDALDAARRLAEAGVPLFLAPPSSKEKIGFKLPSGWEKLKANPAVVDKWKPGWALCAVMGHVVDAIDVDPRNGGTLEALQDALGGTLPTIYGKATTPSGGEHYLVATMGVRKIQNIVPGVDIQAGNAEGVGRGFIFLAPTVRPSKATGEAAPYQWETDPDLGVLLLEGDDSVEGLRELLVSHSKVPDNLAELDYDGPSYDDLDDAQKQEADEHVQRVLEYWRTALTEAKDWPEGERDERGRGWEALGFQFAWSLAKMAACPWTLFSEDGAQVAFDTILPFEMADDVANKWYTGIVGKAGEDAVSPPPWEGRTSAQEDFEQEMRKSVSRPPCDHTNESIVTRWLITQIGQGPLSGLFRRGEDLVYTPRVGEDGYVIPDNPDDHDGPSQVRRMAPLKLANRVDGSYHVFRKTKNGEDGVVFRKDLAERAMADLDRCLHLRRISMVSHTPLVRADGTVLDTPGYDASSRVLYLPERGLQVDPVPDTPTRSERDSARDLLLGLLEDFPFISDHDRANYLGCFILPLLRLVVPPPYQMLIIGAPQRGSGKSLLAELIRTVHGGVFRSEIPDSEDERRKVITSILDSTSAPVVQFDNVSGQLKSPTLDGLLTNAVWSDRRLGVSENIVAANDRLWVVTGNNIHIGGDMDRRVLWSTINANLEHPELRPAGAFRYHDLSGWVREHRGDVIHAMLVLVRAWAVAGRPVEAAPTSDSFGPMLQVLRGVLAHAGVRGVVGHQESKPERPDTDSLEWSTFLQAAQRVMGEMAWTVRELLDHLSDFEEEALFPYELPGKLSDNFKTTPHSVAKSLGKMLSSRQGQWCDGLKAVAVGGGGNNKRAVKWTIQDSKAEYDLL